MYEKKLNEKLKRAAEKENLSIEEIKKTLAAENQFFLSEKV